MEFKKVKIGTGKNAEVFVVDEEEFLKKLCVKKVKKFPEVKINPIDIEFDFQDAVNELGIKTPRNVIMVRNKNTKEEYIIMERIMGVSLGDALDPLSTQVLPNAYVHEVFFQKLKNMIEKMHENRIYHRDLHRGNVMCDENGNPVIIDFGAATYGYGDLGDIYKAQGFRLVDASKGEYVFGESMLPDDLNQVKNLEALMRKFFK
jgi:tRNA A-37 threonylcarbamoyl transferase component Bud32